MLTRLTRGRLSPNRRLDSESGFTLIELLVAMFIVMLVMSSMLGLFIGTLKTVTQAKQRQTATALATQTLERLRALPYDVVVAGINSTTTSYANDPLITDKATPAPKFVPGVGGINETLLVNTTTTTAPLANHVATEQVENVDYTVGVYVTQGATTQPSYNLTALVTYESSVSNGVKTVIQRSNAYSPNGCLSTSTHPFSGPCQASFTGQAGVTAGFVTVTNPNDSTQPIPGMGGSKLGVTLPGLSTTTRIEQTATVSATAQTTGAESSASATPSGGIIGSASADTDPSSVPPGFQMSDTPVQSGSSALNLTGDAGWLQAKPSTTDTGTVAAQTAAGATGCTGMNDVPFESKQPCAAASLLPQGDSAYITGGIAGASVPVTGIPAFTIIDISSSPDHSRAVAGRFTTSGGFACTASTPDCAHASSSRALGTVVGGALPAGDGVDDDDLNGYWGAFKLDALTELAQAESGLGSNDPSLTRSGVLAYWDGSGYSQLLIEDVLDSDFSQTLPLVERTYRSGAESVTVTLDTSLFVGKVQEDEVDTCSGTTACTARATSATALRADMHYTVKRADGSLITEFAVQVDLGSVLADTSFREAPSA